jgi:hypothetical protein
LVQYFVTASQHLLGDLLIRDKYDYNIFIIIIIIVVVVATKVNGVVSIWPAPVDLEDAVHLSIFVLVVHSDANGQSIVGDHLLLFVPQVYLLTFYWC